MARLCVNLRPDGARCSRARTRAPVRRAAQDSTHVAEGGTQAWTGSCSRLLGHPARSIHPVDCPRPRSRGAAGLWTPPDLTRTVDDSREQRKRRSRESPTARLEISGETGDSPRSLEIARRFPPRPQSLRRVCSLRNIKNEGPRRACPRRREEIAAAAYGR
jgi:hypothetical protein